MAGKKSLNFRSFGGKKPVWTLNSLQNLVVDDLDSSADTFGSMDFNYNPICDCLSYLDDDKILDGKRMRSSL